MQNLTRLHRYLLSILSGVLMIISFPFTGSLTIIAFVAWVPLLLVEDNISRHNYKSGKVFIHAYLTFVIYNVGTTWWVWFASPSGSMLAFFLNSLLMAIVFYGFHLTKKYVGSKEGYAALILYWIGFEYFHYDWESSWPWLSLGNVFSITPSWVQWFSYSGVLGGSMWILIINLIFFRILQNVWMKKETWRIQTPLFYTVAFVFITPMIISLTMYYRYQEKGNEIEVVAIQPNIDPYDDKFNKSMSAQQRDMITLAETKITDQTKLVVAPETAIPYATRTEDKLTRTPEYNIIASARLKHENAVFIWGLSSSIDFDHKNSSASIDNKNGTYTEYYNSSVLIDTTESPKIIHKSKLVPGVEKIPFLSFFPFMADWSINMGGSSVTLGVEKEPSVFTTSKFKIAPVICYESAFGGFVAQQCNKGAELICIITNDGWWRDTPGYKQHASFASLRAIENRRSVVRSANTGKSCIVNQTGDFTHETEWWVQDVIRANVRLNSEKSFYTRYGDVLGRSFGFVSLLLLLFTFVKKFKRYVAK